MNCQVVQPGLLVNRVIPLRELEAHLTCRLGGHIRDFHLSTHVHGLVLQGRARTYYAKQLAQHAVMQATQRPIAANEIVVD